MMQSRNCNPGELSRVHLIISGRVQGVGFRFFAQRRAMELGLAGWVRNRGDGTVEIMAEGERGALNKFLAAMREGPRAAFVTGVKSSWLTYRGDLPKAFEIRPTAWS